MEAGWSGLSEEPQWMASGRVPAGGGGGQRPLGMLGLWQHPAGREPETALRAPGREDLASLISCIN